MAFPLASSLRYHSATHSLCNEAKYGNRRYKEHEIIELSCY